MTELIVRPYAPQDRAAWDEFVARSKNGTFLFMRGFMEYHSDRFIDASVLATDPAGRLLALFPANRTGPRIASHAGLTYGGMVCDETMLSSVALDIFAAWFAHCRAQGVDEIVYKATPPIYHRMPADEDRYALFYHGAMLYRRDMTQTVDLTAQAPLQERRRRGVKKAQKSGLVVRESADVEAFWAVLAGNLASRHGLRPVHTADELRLLQGRFPDHIRLFAVYERETLCAGTLLFLCGPTVHAQYIASSDEARSRGALDILFSTLLDRFRDEFRYFDFGTSNEDDGTFLNRGLSEFKEGFGARGIVQDFFRIDLARWEARGSERR
jgi:hypothetical protein